MISIIIPVYNASEYIAKCVESIRKQSMKEWELILVDDGSSDSSGALCDKIAKNDDRIRVIHQENKGVSAARNAGLDAALGEFIMFVDADDWLEPDLCETLQKYMKKADVVISGFYCVTEKGKQENLFNHNDLTISIGNQLSLYFDELYEKNLINSPWAKLYRKSLIGEQRFSEGTVLGEDLLFNLSYFRKCSEMAVIQFAGYDYNCLNAGSATRKFRQNDFRQVIFLYEQVKKFQQDIIGEEFTGIAAERKCCLNEINLLQLLFYSSMDNKIKKTLTRSVLESQIFKYCAQRCGSLSFKYEIPRKLCLYESYKGLFLFFGIKMRLRTFMKI